MTRYRLATSSGKTYDFTADSYEQARQICAAKLKDMPKETSAEKYCRTQESALSRYNSTTLAKKLRFPKPRWTDSAFQERLLRCGREFKLLGLTFDDAIVQRVVEATLIEDFLTSTPTTSKGKRANG